LLLTFAFPLQASQSGSIEAVRLLLRHGARPNIANNNGTTALMRAAQSGRLLVVITLVDSGASVHIRDNQGMTALMLACQVGQ
jgi:ankyrin repeat protein